MIAPIKRKGTIGETCCALGLACLLVGLALGGWFLLSFLIEMFTRRLKIL